MSASRPERHGPGAVRTPPSLRSDPLPLLPRSLISFAVLAPWVAATLLLSSGPVVSGSPAGGVLTVSVLVGVCASVTCLVLALTDPGLHGRRGRWVAAFVLASAIAPVVYLWSWQWRRPADHAQREGR